MAGASKVVEHMGHAAHAPRHEGAPTDRPGLGMRIGVTMASLGAILALFTVTANASRTELLGLYSQQTIASLRLETSATKYRLLETQLRQLRALAPDRAQSRADMMRFASLIRSYRTERDAASEWVKTFAAPEAWLTTAIEHYEWAELCAELGIVASSLALLFSNRKIWFGTLTLGAGGLLIFAATALPTMGRMHAAERTVADAKEKSEASAATTAKGEDEDDDALLRAFEVSP